MGEWNRFGNECFEVFWFEIPGHLNLMLRTERETGCKNVRFNRLSEAQENGICRVRREQCLQNR